MSGEPKTLTPEPATLQGLIVTLGVHGYSLAFQEGRWWAVPPQDTPYEWSDGDTPWEAASKALGVPVVARDEAAESRGIGWDDVTEEHVVGAFLDAQAEAHRYRNALEALLNSSHRGIYDAAWALEAVANAEALISPGLDDDYRKAKAQEAYERRLAGGESDPE